MHYEKINRFYYGAVRFLANFPRIFLFRSKLVRNEIKNKKGPFVILANHQAALDFVNLIGATREPMHFVISRAFYRTLPGRAIIDKIGLIPKQQFQTALRDITRMKAVVDNGSILVLYPAGLMCEDGLSTPIPETTYKFIQWIGADIYVARSSGTYFCTPKWAKSKKSRPGRTEMDIYKLFEKDELKTLTEEQIKEKVDAALLFDAYHEQEKIRHKYKNGGNIEGLERVLYICPNCRTEHSMRVRKGREIYCESCGFSEMSDAHGFFSKTSEVGEEIRYVSDWSRFIHGYESDIALRGEGEMKLTCDVHTVKEGERRYSLSGRCEVALLGDKFSVVGVLDGEAVDYEIPTATFASLPFSPGKYFELQHGEQTLRCYPDDRTLVQRFVNRVKIYHEIHSKNYAVEHHF